MSDHQDPEEPAPPAPASPRVSETTLEERLLREPFRFYFFQAVRLLERLFPGRSPVGYHGPPAGEVVRFRTHVSLSAPASEIFDIEPSPDGREPVTMWVTFLGLAGSAGTLPRHYTSLLLDPSMRPYVKPLAALLDIFNHRVISLYYRAWEKYRFPVSYERTGEDRFSQYLFSLVGLGQETLRHRLEISDQVLLHYSGLLARRPRPAVALEGLLQDYFGVPVTVEQFTGQWFLMNPDALTALGPPGQANRLGVDSVLWERVWDPQARFRVRVGPLTLQQFRDFLPDGDAYRHLVELTRFYAGEELSFEVQPILEAEEVPWCALGQERTSRLGWAMWLKVDDFDTDRSEPVFLARAAPVGVD